MPVVVEVDEEDQNKDLDRLDIEIPVLTPRVYREYKNLDLVDPAAIEFSHQPYLEFSEEQKREIVFRDVASGEVSHTTILDIADGIDFSSVIGFFAQSIMKDLRLVSGYDALYPKVKSFVRDHLFGRTVELDDANTLRNLSEPGATRAIIEGFQKAINALTVQDKGNARISHSIKLRQTRPFVAQDQAFLVPRQSVFNRIIGDSGFELAFAAFLDKCDDIISFAKNYLAVGFKLDYVNSKGEISNYIPDFFVKVDEKTVFIIETKGLEELDLPEKTARLKQWCEDTNAAQGDVRYDFVYVDEEGFGKYPPKSFGDLLKTFREYR